MSFQPVVPFGGTAGWAFLQRTLESQKEAFAKSPTMERDVAYFKEQISKVETADQLVSDYRLMKVALGAFGLDDDVTNKAYIQKVLEEGSLDPDSFANRMVDKRYLALTEAFGFDLSPPNTQLSDFADGITEQYQTRQFEIAVGESDTEMRLALSLERDLKAVVDSQNSDDGRWYSVMGNEPLRKVFETAFGFPPSFAGLDIDKQVGEFRAKANAFLGNGEVSQFANPQRIEDLNRLFLVRSQISNGGAAQTSNSIALTLLQNGL